MMTKVAIDAARRARPLTAALVSAVLLLPAGCEDRGAGALRRPIDAPPPAHPALDGGPLAGQRGPVSPHAHGGDALPPGHPPIAGGAGTGTGAASGRGAPPPALDASGRLTLAGVDLAPPSEWEIEAPDNSMRLAQFRVPAAAGDDEDGLVAISEAGGGVQTNIDRWRDQFDGRPEAQTSVVAAGTLQATRVRIEGSFRGMGGGAGRPGQAMLVAMVPVPGRSQDLIVRLTGPRATVDQASAAFDALLASIRVK